MTDRLDRCDAIDVLEEAVLTRRPVTVDLADGGARTGRVVDVITRDGEEWAELEDGTRVDLDGVVNVRPG
jgi:Rho-binding antiterminator